MEEMRQYSRRRPIASARRQQATTRQCAAPTQVEQEVPNNDVEDNDNDVAEIDRGACPGGPADPLVLSSFRTHVAAAIWEGQERDVLRCHCLTSKLLKWRYCNESNSALWRDLVKSSKLMHLRTMSYKGPNRNLITAFVERWQPETNSFHMPFGEMTITLDDVQCLTGLNITGRIVRCGGGDDEAELDIICRMLGVSRIDASTGVSEKCGNAVKLNWLLSKFGDTMSTDDEAIALHRARAFLLYTLGCTIFTDKTGERVSTHYLKLFEHPDEFGSYAWGTEALAFLYRQLGLTSRANVKQISGYLTLLEAWIYEHFPTIIRSQPNVDYRNGQPLVLRWAQQTHASGSECSVKAYRELLDALKPEDVVWDLHSTFWGEFVRPEVAFYEGCITAGDIIEPYLLDCVLRQFGMVQTIPRAPLTSQSGRGSKKTGQNRIWGLLGSYFEEWASHKLSLERRGRVVYFAWQCVPEYFQWYHQISHPRVQNPNNCSNIEVTRVHHGDHTQVVRTALDYLQPVVSRWRAGEFSPEFALRQVEEAYEALRASQPSYQQDESSSRLR